MAHSMSPPPQRPYQRPFSPFQQQPAHSPPGIALPPAKRQRLSPGTGSPNFSTSPFPDSPYGPFSAPAASPPPFNVPQKYSMSPPPSGVMGPPPRPTAEQKAAKEKEEKEKVTDISDISDAMWGSGVDLREEENYLSSTNRTYYGVPTSSHSLADSTAIGGGQNNGFAHLSQNIDGNYLQPGGPALQGLSSMESIESEIDRKHREAALRYAKDHEQHLRDPFLMGNSMRLRLHKIAIDQGVHLDVKGLYEPPKPPPKPPQQPQGVQGKVIVGENDTGLAAIRAKSVPEIQHAFLEESAKYVDILSLVSLATNERLRAIADESFAVARGRQTGSDGTVPAQIADLAVGQGRRSVSIKAEDRPLSPWSQPKSGGGSVVDSQDTVSFSSALPDYLSKIALSERSTESGRIKRRAERAAKAKDAPSTVADGDAMTGTSPTTPAPGTPVPATPVSNESPSTQIAPGKPMTKKEREKMAKAGQTEEVLHKNANLTAAFQLGFGKKSKKYSWMTGGAGNAAPTNQYKPSSISKGNDGGVEIKKEANGEVRREKKSLGKERKFGDWREDGEGGRGVQLRDLVTVLERDGKSKRALELAWLKLESEGKSRSMA